MLEVLKSLALMNASRKVVKISSKELAEKIGQSLQTAARRLKELEEEGLIDRTLTKDGQFVVITEKGKQTLYREYMDYKKIFEGEESIKIRGEVFSGVGEGRYYVSLNGYKRQFKEKLGFDPYPGTLNLKIPKEEMYFRRRLDEEPGILIEGFSTEDRTFGEVKAFKCRVDGVEGAVVIPKRTHYPSEILEIIAPVKLREKLGLKDGDTVEVEVLV
ncbi:MULTISPECIES: winged helix-turn-helix domain-containing protein/riboflavin kinase [unclassified Archaeoglobus]|jgi:riboflavin kinase|uniref:winged helix-turn-helix domain-containing protein/riboflavin kinase n=1 Tax=unclassified Archaeoglobus TaxID=2643606 RepID=UPI0025C674DE|nr:MULTISPECIES: winged helix-turn-helix domain-containing protein/riboflavin kinase [unclassified Archaeoglobus]